MFHLNISLHDLYKWLCLYRKASRCTFFWERKNSCCSKFVQLLLLHRVKAKWSKNRAAQGFHYINLFISNTFGPNSKTCTCEVRAAWSGVSRGLTVFCKNGPKVCRLTNALQKISKKPFEYYPFSQRSIWFFYPRLETS